jgi:3-dehydroquinate synthase
MIENLQGEELHQYIYEKRFDDFLKTGLSGRMVIITDENLLIHYKDRLAPFEVIVIPSGEVGKTQQTVDFIFKRLIDWEVDRDTTICGLGGGVVTDLAGYVASVFKRGLPLVQVPTSVLGMVDAALGGKNGINWGSAKNMIGSIYQPRFIVFDLTFLKSLPDVEWQSGFAEIIKHACIRDSQLFEWLERESLSGFQNDHQMLNQLIQRNVRIKMQVVMEDPNDNNERLLLNFGHTIGHAIEHLHQLPHGHAISIGMRAAAILSDTMGLLGKDEVHRLEAILEKYGLPVSVKTDEDSVIRLIRQDKKRQGTDIRFVLLDRIGNGLLRSVSVEMLQQRLGKLLC